MKKDKKDKGDNNKDETNQVIKAESKKTECKNKKTYPFIEELVSELYNESLNELIEKHVSTPVDKKVFLMYIMMYFIIHLQIEENKQENKKDLIKQMLNDLIANKDKRKMFIDFFDEKFQDIEFTESAIKQINGDFHNLLEE